VTLPALGAASAAKPAPATVMDTRVSSTATAKAASTRMSPAAPSRAAPPEPIAIVGMAGQFAKARDLVTYWRNLAEGRNCIEEVPAQRWDVQAYYQPGEPVPGKTTSRWLGALEDYDRFDPLFFSISPTEAQSMDPQQRLFLQTSWTALEDAGYAPGRLAGTRCGVFVGCAAGDYHQQAHRQRLSAHGFTGAATSILAARIAYALDLQGPCVSIDTAWWRATAIWRWPAGCT
jgi:acyl transferase domain-containing protein